MKSSPALKWVTVFGLGYLRPAPGTWGSMPPVALAAILMAMGLGPAGSPLVYNLALLLVLLVFSYACLAVGDLAEATFLRKDPSNVVADETAGQALTLMFLPAAAVASPATAALCLLLAFLLFRIMDILKPWPARQIQAVPGGWGVLLDDLMAGVYALIALQLIARLLIAP